MTHNEDSNGGSDATRDPHSLLGMTAKWLVPSASILFLAWGYIIQSAQVSLLGIDVQGDFPNSYFVDAADFVRDSVLLFLSRSLSGGPFTLLHHPVLLVCACGLLVATVVVNLTLRTWPGAIRLAQIALAGVAIAKFLTLDAPLLQIEDLITASSGSDWSLISEPPAQKSQTPATASQSLTPPAAGAPPTNFEGFIQGEAVQIFADILCSRTGAEHPCSTSEILRGVKLPTLTKEQWQDRLEDEFICNIVVGMILFAGAILMLRSGRRTTSTSLLALLVAAYSLSIPYAYGKLLKDTTFELGNLRVGSDLMTAYTDPKDGIVDKGSLPLALLVSQTAQGANMLTLVPMDCGSTVTGQNPQQAATYFIFNSELKSFEQIAKVDVIEWTYSNSQPCPDG